MAVGDFYRLIVQSSLTGEDNILVNTFTFRQGLALVFDTPEEDLVQAWIASGETLYRGTFTGATGVDLLSVVPLPGGVVTFQEARPHTLGTQAGETIPFQIAALISYRTALLGRRGRGRTYLPPASETNVTSGRFNATYLGAVSAFAEALMPLQNGILTAAWELAVWSETLEAGNVVVSYQTHNVPATQRSRRL